MRYFIVEIQNRADGIDNVLDIVSRQSLATGLSYFYQRCSTTAGTTLYPTASILLIDSEGHIIENKHLTTAYVEPEQEG